jgi:hypothetical protein
MAANELVEPGRLAQLRDLVEFARQPQLETGHSKAVLLLKMKLAEYSPMYLLQ